MIPTSSDHPARERRSRAAGRRCGLLPRAANLWSVDRFLSGWHRAPRDRVPGGRDLARARSERRLLARPLGGIAPSASTCRATDGHGHRPARRRPAGRPRAPVRRGWPPAGLRRQRPAGLRTASIGIDGRPRRWPDVVLRGGAAAGPWRSTTSVDQPLTAGAALSGRPAPGSSYTARDRMVRPRPASHRPGRS